jgi:hypothetical protein
MAWPTNKPDSNAFASNTKSIKESRPELETMSQAVNDIVDFIDTTSIANNYILQYNSTSGRLEFVPNSGGGGGVTNPLTADLDVDTYKIKSTTSQVVVESSSTNPIKLHASEIHVDVQSGSGTSSPTLEFQTSSTGAALIKNNNNANQIRMDGVGYLSLSSSGQINLNGSSYSIGDTATTGYFLPPSKGTSGQYLKFLSGNVTSFADLEIDISNDTSPTLGGNLNIGTSSIVSNTSQNIVIEPGTGGRVRIHNLYNLPTADGTSGQAITTDGFGNLTFSTISGGAGSDTQIEASPTGNITVTQPDSGGAFTISLAEPLNNPIDANNNAISNPVFRGYNEHINTTLGTSGTLTPDVADGNVATITLSGNITINGFSGAAAGDSMTLILRQPSSGGPYTLSSTMKFAGGNKTLSTTANAIDVLSIFWDNNDYIASLSTNFS